jgi:hypothetical protein
VPVSLKTFSRVFCFKPKQTNFKQIQVLGSMQTPGDTDACAAMRPANGFDGGELKVITAFDAA